MKLRLLSVLALSSFVAYGACADEASPGLTGPAGNLEVAIAPLTLAGVADSCLDIEVRNSTERVFATRITSQQFGNGEGDATYIGTCDASEATNTVFLDIVGVYSDTATCTATFEDGDQTDSGGTTIAFNDSVGIIEVVADCNENADTLVEFDVTILRSANQGFFDIAVNFNDMFCSAKFDTCYAGDVPIALLFDADGNREHTGVAGLACTAGTGTTASELVLTDPEVLCVDSAGDDVIFTIGLATAADGNGTATASSPTTGDYTLGYGLYYGNEALECEGAAGDCQKVYYNIAVNLGSLETQLLEDCEFNWNTSARPVGSTVINADGSLSTSLTTYPTIDFAGVFLQVGTAPLCSQHPLNGEGSDVSTGYAAPGDVINQAFSVGDEYFDSFSGGGASTAFDAPN